MYSPGLGQRLVELHIQVHNYYLMLSFVKTNKKENPESCRSRSWILMLKEFIHDKIYKHHI